MNNYPIILAHGIARFDFLSQRLSKDLSALSLSFAAADNELHYFKGIARHLRNNGFDVYPSSVGFAEGVENRAAALKKEIETALKLRSGKEKVHIIAHSMGGLDARHMLVNHGMAKKVASLTTIGTPHSGTSFADWGMAHEGHQLIKILNNFIDISGLADLTTEACGVFNELAQSNEAANNVVYQTYASSESQKQVFAPLQLAWQIIMDSEGANDGLVPLKSQQWQPSLTDGKGLIKQIRQQQFPVPADHLNEIGWWDMNQLKFSDLLHVDLPTIIRNYEESIRAVYLQISLDMQMLD